MPLNSQLPIAVIGGHKVDNDALDTARDLGRKLAGYGYAVICGGRNTGVMNAVCEGCAQEGGTSIGILPTLDVDTASKHCTIVVPTNLGNADDNPKMNRNWVIVPGALCVFAIAGTSGTRNELMIAKQMKKRVFGLHGPPEPEGHSGPTVWNANGSSFTRYEAPSRDQNLADALRECGQYLRGINQDLGW
jgi:uncharacterized protein (TIGR00725 family)